MAEVSERVYHELQQHDGTSSGTAKEIVLIEGIGVAMSAVYRRSGLVQANTLLGGLMRNITQLSRSSRNVTILLDIPIEIEDSRELRHYDATPKPRKPSGVDLESAFSNSAGETLMLSCSHEQLSRTLEAGADHIVVVHDGWGRTANNRKSPSERVVEVVKDRSGDLAGLWDVWKEP